MFRPFYALIVLLEVIAGSLLLVQSAPSQTLTDEMTDGSRSIVIFAWSCEEPTVEDQYNECAGIGEQVGHCVEGATECLANWVPAVLPIDESAWIVDEAGNNSAMILVGTGYDAAYDFAMFQGSYHDVAAEALEAAGLVEAPASIDGALSEQDAGTAWRLLQLGLDRAVGVGQWAWSETWRPYLTHMGDAISAQQLLLEREEEARQTWRALQTASNRISEVAAIMGSGLAAPYREWPQSAHWAVTATVKICSAIQHAQIEVATHVYRQDSVLLHAASALDELSVKLRAAARQLRNLATQSNVARDDSPHVARRGK